MIILQMLPGTEWKALLMGSEEWHFLPEAAIRTVIMFLVLLTGLRLLGKRGVKQLSVFELVVIIGLGSAAGDPMFYKDVGILPAILVFLLIILSYKLVIFLVGKSKRIEKLVEGNCVCLIKEGKFAIEEFKKEALSEDEFFAELRMHSISHLGQVKEAIVEISGDISVFYYPDEAVKWGLPIMPGKLDEAVEQIREKGHYACIFCGFSEIKNPMVKSPCPECKREKWVKAVKEVRIR
ncbi:MAG: YetF domain-containing protein [Ferruginibacter sp.]